LEVKKVFISGPMTGLPDFNRKAFFEAEEKLRNAGFSVFNPAWLRFDEFWDSKAIATVDLAALSQCDYIYQLEGWENSLGATAEWEAANWMHVMVVNHSWLEWYVEELERRKENEA